LLNTGVYVFKFVLLPIAISILMLSLFNILIEDKKFEKLINLLKYVFKMLLTIMFTVFGLFSTINIISSGMKDGLSLKITKYAIKNYVPILGGYISEGFDFVKSCSIPSFKNIYLKHYVTRSWEEYVWKVKVRGYMYGLKRTYDAFFDMNPDMRSQKTALLLNVNN
jgi:fumarate reductase subunit D